MAEFKMFDKRERRKTVELKKFDDRKLSKKEEPKEKKEEKKPEITIDNIEDFMGENGIVIGFPEEAYEDFSREIIDNIGQLQEDIVKNLWKHNQGFVKKKCEIRPFFEMTTGGIHQEMKEFHEETDTPHLRIFYKTKSDVILCLVVNYDIKESGKLRWRRMTRMILALTNDKDKGGRLFQIAIRQISNNYAALQIEYSTQMRKKEEADKGVDIPYL